MRQPPGHAQQEEPIAAAEFDNSAGLRTYHSRTERGTHKAGMAHARIEPAQIPA